MLRKIIFSGQNNSRFILSYFPDIIEHVYDFERNVAQIAAVFYTTREGEVEVELKNNQLTLFTIDSLFEKQFRLRIVDRWDEKRFVEQMGDKINWGIIYGQWLSGKTTMCKHLGNQGYFVLDSKVTLEEIKKQYEEMENPPEGDIPDGVVVDRLIEKVSKQVQINPKTKFLFDSLPGKENSVYQ